MIIFKWSCISAFTHPFMITAGVRLLHFEKILITESGARRSLNSRSRHWGCSVKKVFLEIWQNSQENPCAKDHFWIKLQALGLRPATLFKRVSGTGTFCEISKNTVSNLLQIFFGLETSKLENTLTANLYYVLLTYPILKFLFFWTSLKKQKQPPEVFCRKRYSWKRSKFHRKTPVLESFLIIVQTLRPVTLLKRDSKTGVFLCNLRNF